MRRHINALSTLIPLLIISILLTACGGGSGASVFSRNGVAIAGWDPVSYHQESGPQRGSAEITSSWNDALWQFSSTANRETFLKDPERWAPAYGGWCAWAMAESGGLTAINPASYVIQDGRLLLFYDGTWGDTRALWQDGNPQDLASAADRAWQQRLSSDSQ